MKKISFTPLHGWHIQIPETKKGMKTIIFTQSQRKVREGFFVRNLTDTSNQMTKTSREAAGSNNKQQQLI
jgi:hypothetical protein